MCNVYGYYYPDDMYKSGEDGIIEFNLYEAKVN